MRAIFWKEIADHFGRRRFVFILALVAVGFLWGWFVTVREVAGGGAGTVDEFLFLQVFTANSGLVPPLLWFVAFFGPLFGIVLGFDAINSERVQGTLARVLAQPVFRDAVYNGKFLAGLVTLSVVIVSMVLAVLGLSMFLLGFAPKGEEVVRLIGFTVISVAYVALWLALAMTCSIFFRSAVVSVLVSIGLWLFTAFFVALLIAPALADLIVPEILTEVDALRNLRIEQWIQRASPFGLFSEATQMLLTPGLRTLGPLFLEETTGLLPTPISAAQSLRLVWPHIVVLISVVAMLLAISYTKFLKEEIRA